MQRFWLLLLLLLSAAAPADGCQYCRLAATDPEAARMAARMHSGSFPLDATINQFQPAAPAPVLTAPPDPGRIATSAADLPVSAPRTAAPAVKPPKPVASPPRPALWSATWADAGLLGLLAAGAWFCWRTRRESAPVG